MLAQVREPLLSVLRISPDFRPAYDPLLSMATALARSDAAAPARCSPSSARIQPARAEATQLLNGDAERSIHGRSPAVTTRGAERVPIRKIGGAPFTSNVARVTKRKPRYDLIAPT